MSRTRSLPSRAAVGGALCLSASCPAQPLVDDRVWSEMDRAPQQQHPLVLTIELARRPLELRAMIPTPEEYNDCTAAWLAWEDMVARRDAGEQIAEEEVQLALLTAETADSAVDAKQESAYTTYHADYHQIVGLSVPPVLSRLRAALGEREVRWPSEHVQFLTIDADADEFDVILLEDAITRISYDMNFVPALDQSRQSIRADDVHDPSGPFGFTGNGVKVAVIDEGYPQSHPRLPVIDSSNYQNTTQAKCDGVIDDDLKCSDGHGTLVAGVIFCQPDGGDSYVGIAYGATPIAARVAITIDTAECHFPDLCTSLGGNWTQIQEPAIEWAMDDRGADVVNLSRLGADQGDDRSTHASSIVSLNADWLIYTYGASITHSCGNIGRPPYRLAPPSGAYNVLSVGAYEDNNTAIRSDDVVWDDTSEGPTQDDRRKPDLCAPGHDIVTTKKDGSFSTNPSVSGTSFAAPHVAGTIALMLEARPSLTPRQIHAIVLNATDTLPGMSLGWDGDAGWGALDAYRAVEHRNRISDNELAQNESKIWVIQQPDPGEEVVLTVVWHREMLSASQEVDGSPHDLNLHLDGKLPNQEWTLDLAVSNRGERPGFEGVYDNVEQVRFFQADSGQPQYQFRVRVVRVQDDTALLQQEFTLASRRAFTAIPPL